MLPWLIVGVFDGQQLNADLNQVGEACNRSEKIQSRSSKFGNGVGSSHEEDGHSVSACGRSNFCFGLLLLFTWVLFASAGRREKEGDQVWKQLDVCYCELGVEEESSDCC